MYNASVLAVPPYGAETWPLNNTLVMKICGFDSREIEDIRWPNFVSNKELR